MMRWTDGPGEASSPAGDGAAARRRLHVVLLVVAAAALVVLVTVLALRPTVVVPERETVVATAPAAPRSTTASPATTPPVESLPPTPTVPAADPARARAELAEVAALLDTPLVLSSPPEWDRWLPQSKRYPGASTEEDIATCPRLADRLSSALGVRMSYWTGTLPNGPGGCTWATVPLSYDGPYDYPYVLNVGYLADGTTTEDWRHHFYEHQGAVCPDVDVPAVDPDAVLVRCEDDGIGYVLVLPDARRPGVWFLQTHTRTDAAHPPSYALTELVDAVVAVYG
jgi:hypothetical protein